MDKVGNDLSTVAQKKVLTTAVGNAELYANTTNVTRLKELEKQKDKRTTS